MSRTITPAPWYSWEQWDNLSPYCEYEEGRSGLTCCPLNILTAASVDSEDANFPFENVSDEHPKRIYRAASGVKIVTIEATLPAEASSLFLFNTNANVIKVSATEFVEIEWFSGNEWFDGNSWWPVSSVDVPVEVVESGERNAVGILFTALTGAKKLTIELETTKGEEVEVGILWAGAAVTVNNFVHGMTEGQVDYSIMKELSNGSRSYKKRDVVRTFSGKVIDEYPEWTDKLLLEVSRKYGKKAMPWIITDTGESRWLIFGGLSRLMSTTYQSHVLADTSISIIEVL